MPVILAGVGAAGAAVAPAALAAPAAAGVAGVAAPAALAGGGGSMLSSLGGGGAGSMLSSLGGGGGGGIMPEMPGIGNVLGLALGAGQFLEGKRLQKKAEGKFPGFNDPAEQSLINELRSKQRTFETGTALKPATEAINKSVQATNRGILRASGGNVGLAIKGISSTQRAAAQAQNELFIRSQENVRFFQGLKAKTIQTQARRRLQLQLLQSGQAQADARSLQTQGRSNFLGALSFIAPPGGFDPSGLNKASSLNEGV